ncbi:hypothetical protein KC207_05930 [Phycicoccus sp. BSK3Z-2]|uniref:EccD-like transmembrane domain-containing protein n=1 Tax=Phycicoccus avicenniae TaxID=2828860 RepID=A0A941D8K0_9MICO|nr:hypothetical protein [Phycicoccus avicenniae]MBR7742830.1 hypothetical protein [Phycicoccus avicenniae]
MSTTQQLTLVADERHYDLVVPVGTRVTEVLSVLGIPSAAGTGSVATAAGHVYGPQDRIGEDLPQGSVLTVVRTTTHRVHRDVVSLDRSSSAAGARPSAPAWAGGSRLQADEGPAVSLVDDATRRRSDDPDATVSRAELRRARTDRRVRAARPRPPGATTAVVTGAGLVVVLAGVLGLAADPSGLPAPVRWTGAALLLAAAVAVVLLSPRERATAPVARLVAAPALAAAGGLLTPLPDSPARVAVSVVLACALAAVVTAVASADGSPASRAERTATACLAGVGVLVAASVLWERPPAAAAAVVVGLVPVLLRALPSASLDVDPTQLLDTDRLSTTVWSVRAPQDGRRRRVTDLDVRDRVAQARAVVSAGTVYLAVAAAVAGWVLAVTPALSTLAPWSRWVVLVLAAVALGYQARQVRDRTARFAMLAAAGSLVVSAAVAVLGWDRGLLWPTVALGVVLGGVALLASVALAGGWTSTRMSRSADRLESFAVVTVLPLALVAAGAVEALRRLTSG